MRGGPGVLSIAAHDIIIDCDFARRRIRVSAAEWHGVSAGATEISASSFFARIHRHDRKRVLRDLVGSIEAGREDFAIDYRFRRADGTYADVCHRGVIMRQAGVAVRAIGAMWDITERKRAERRAAAAEEIAQLGSWAENEDGSYEWSAGMYRILGLDRSVPAGLETAKRLAHPDDRKQVLDAVREGAPFVEFRIIRPDGALRIVVSRRAQDSSTGLWYGTLQDVTERRVAARAIEELGQRNALILGSIAEGVAGFDCEGRLVFANPAAQRILGWSEEKLRALREDHRALHVVPPCDAECAICHTLDSGNVRTGEYSLTRDDGQEARVDFCVSPMTERGRITGCVVTFRDVTDRVRIEQQLERAQRIASLGRIAATVAHEFNNVLAGIQPAAELLQRRSQGDPALLNVASQIASAVARGRSITDDILRDVREREPAHRIIDLAAWLRRLAPAFAVVAPRVAVKIVIHAEDVAVRCSPEQMEQIVLNLCINAAEAMVHGGTVTIALEREFDMGAPIARLRVIDDGPGIAPDVLRRIFEPLFTTKPSGTGLGLAVVRQLVQRNGGRISVRSEPGKGTEFQLRFPMEPRDGERERRDDGKGDGGRRDGAR